MFDWLLPENHAIAILKKDHDTVKGLFDDYEGTEVNAARTIIDKALIELKVHAVIEEEIFYPTVRKQVGAGLMNEADEEHHVAKILIAELEQSSGGGDHRDAKFKVLAESVRHHIKEEEEKILPKAKDLDIDFERLGTRMLIRKNELLKNGIPPDGEHDMVARAGRSADSPAAASKRRKKAPAARTARTPRKTATARTTKTRKSASQ
jgi:hypothetical protein